MKDLEQITKIKEKLVPRTDLRILAVELRNSELALHHQININLTASRVLAEIADWLYSSALDIFELDISDVLAEKYAELQRIRGDIGGDGGDDAGRDEVIKLMTRAGITPQWIDPNIPVSDLEQIAILLGLK